ncbi:SubName: Full=Uncharacterized protein {ECO:0000313/EMBL:CCA75512.1} [Serendipita indica DSM 11827]|uniref:F-box domain-containing protein n=1 Tax=Serendipita indica (strain DSM 11827) TaxID=1109443 RepID=G4TW19_SERID|nr:SubName: Full=Uncharacterized protein {ECO:0000313/EMBL:CCA75512.1} [Serendipita indica DSM 11827]CCA75512.1 hypothetical protein PIIN_09495 [Serendipita indica DSM 11827]
MRLPAELWQNILERAIFVPKFFDTDPMETYGPIYDLLRSDRLEYWASERLRNRLRRVCQDWNVFLKRFDHRFVDIADVINGVIPTEALPSALRIYLSVGRCKDEPHSPTPSSMCLCRLLNYDPILKIPNNGANATLTPWKLRIIEFSPVRSTISDFLWERYRISNLKSIIYPTPSSLISASNLQAQPTVIWSSMVDLPETVARSTTFFSMLTTLRLTLDAKTCPLPLHLPSLRYLFVSLPFPGRVARLVAWLKVIGYQLTALFCEGDLSERFSQRIWEVCPSIEVLQLSSSVFWTPPPRGHPIHTLQLEPQQDNLRKRVCDECGRIHAVILQLSASMGEYAASGIHTIACSGPWPTARASSGWMGYTGYIGNLFCLKRQAQRHGIRFVDRDWISFEDYVVSQLEMGQPI